MIYPCALCAKFLDSPEQALACAATHLPEAQHEIELTAARRARTKGRVPRMKHVCSRCGRRFHFRSDASACARAHVRPGW